MPSPTSRALTDLRKDGYTAAVVERFNRFAMVRQDLFGFCDVLAVKPDEPVLMVQVTSTDNMSARVKKILDLDGTHEIAANPHVDIQVWGYALRGDQGKRKRYKRRRIRLRHDGYVWSQLVLREE